MNPEDTVPLMLLALHMLALGVIAVIFTGMILLHWRARRLQEAGQMHLNPGLCVQKSPRQPAIWLAVRSSSVQAVQAALRVGRTTPCSWFQGITGEHEFFIGSPIDGWVIVTGAGLPHPGQDVDGCFHFLIRLSAILGHVQFFMLNPALSHHAWARVESGTVKRAYAWTGETVWNQGPKSVAELELQMTCYAYGEHTETAVAPAVHKNAMENAQRVPLLAARWSINPMAVDTDLPSRPGGVAGRSAPFQQD